MRAKFKCESVTRFGYVMMAAVMDNSEENRDFNHATPAATLDMDIDNEKEFVFFKPGKEYYLDFTLAE
jgi:hypothetical protein